ncbi:MAG: hypothetical protein IKS68_04685 [Mailhella sp.]|nr:hypothetical protein [Desulfovibrio sp.]MBR4423501.1 hypothetical protein [Mailhella sp.]MBR4747802.1 hypothetical protein [Desulfovibrio sp.]MBR5050284.1 hypothetical protein [Desulfovibrio sp.]MBR6467497.1 hypothetical protein [Desulfovibrio sp.]
MHDTLIQRRGGAFFCTCQICGREETSVDARSLMERLAGKGWTEEQGGAVCPDCAGFSKTKQQDLRPSLGQAG